MHETAIVRLYTASGEIAGAGLLVGARQVLTCGHVVTSAVGPASNVQPTSNATLSLDFPLVAPGITLEAQILEWAAVDVDLVLLNLTTAPPVCSTAMTLLNASDLWGHPFRAFGFPEKHESGVWSSGRLLAATAQGWIQVEDVKQTGYFVTPGFSGSPVWDETLKGVTGLLVAAEADVGTRAAFMIPASTVVRFWPTLVTSPSAMAILPAATSVPVPVATSTDLKALRARLQRLDSVEIETLCLDHFPAVYDKFSRGLQRGEMINLLLDYCRRNPEEAAKLL